MDTNGHESELVVTAAPFTRLVRGFGAQNLCLLVSIRGLEILLPVPPPDSGSGVQRAEFGFGEFSPCS
jgi:hypothetical protein